MEDGEVFYKLIEIDFFMQIHICNTKYILNHTQRGKKLLKDFLCCCSDLSNLTE